MTIRDFIQQAKSAESLCKDILDHDVEIQMRTNDNLYIGNSFTIDRCGYKFSALHLNSDGTRGSLVLDIRIVEKKEG